MYCALFTKWKLIKRHSSIRSQIKLRRCQLVEIQEESERHRKEEDPRSGHEASGNTQQSDEKKTKQNKTRKAGPMTHPPSRAVFPTDSLERLGERTRPSALWKVGGSWLSLKCTVPTHPGNGKPAPPAGEPFVQCAFPETTPCKAQGPSPSRRVRSNDWGKCSVGGRDLASCS